MKLIHIISKWPLVLAALSLAILSCSKSEKSYKKDGMDNFISSGLGAQVKLASDSSIKREGDVASFKMWSAGVSSWVDAQLLFKKVKLVKANQVDQSKMAKIRSEVGDVKAVIFISAVYFYSYKGKDYKGKSQSMGALIDGEWKFVRPSRGLLMGWWGDFEAVEIKNTSS